MGPNHRGADANPFSDGESESETERRGSAPPGGEGDDDLPDDDGIQYPKDGPRDGTGDHVVKVYLSTDYSAETAQRIIHQVRITVQLKET